MVYTRSHDYRADPLPIALGRRRQRSDYREHQGFLIATAIHKFNRLWNADGDLEVSGPGEWGHQLADAMLDNAALKDLLAKKMVTPAAKREAVAHARSAFELSESRFFGGFVDLRLQGFRVWGPGSLQICFCDSLESRSNLARELHVPHVDDLV
jgi:hypothetical protein